MSAFQLNQTDGRNVLVVEGDWTIDTIGRLEKDLVALPSLHQDISVDVSNLGALDTAGAFLIART